MSSDTADFYPRPPRGGRPPWHRRTCWPKHISIHALREEGDQEIRPVKQAGRKISIHALREEGDQTLKLIYRKQFDFYPRPPRGGRLGVSYHDGDEGEFLSTPSARRATVARDKSRPASPISIHALREEGDKRSMHRATQRTIFLSTPSARRATALGALEGIYGRISIHALREEGDVTRAIKEQWPT